MSFIHSSTNSLSYSQEIQEFVINMLIEITAKTNARTMLFFQNSFFENPDDYVKAQEYLKKLNVIKEIGIFLRKLKNFDLNFISWICIKTTKHTRDLIAYPLHELQKASITIYHV